jgi:small subunit ribosomal protein S2
MKPYIFTERNGIHIIDLQQTLNALETAYALVRESVAAGGTVLFVGTKRQAQETIETEAVRCGMPYVNSRWLGGTLTNWRTIRSRIDELTELERRREAGEFDKLTKKEALGMTRDIERLQGRLGGLREMKVLPKLLFAVDVRREAAAVHEANLQKIPVVALVDTNCDPGGVDYVIPSNDDAIRAIKLLAGKIADAALEGMAMRKEEEAEEVGAVAEVRLPIREPAVVDEELLGDATLAKLQTGAYGDEEGEADADLLGEATLAKLQAEERQEGTKEPGAPEEQKAPEGPGGQA